LEDVFPNVQLQLVPYSPLLVFGKKMRLGREQSRTKQLVCRIAACPVEGAR